MREGVGCCVSGSPCINVVVIVVVVVCVRLKEDDAFARQMHVVSKQWVEESVAAHDDLAEEEFYLL